MLKNTILPNGLKIIAEYVPDVRSASITVIIGAGSSLETQVTSGISHFVEHLMFKGTETRSSQMIAQSIEDYGGSLNAFTEKEHTSYYARVLSDQVSVAIDIFCDMLLNSLFLPEELELERQVILEEIKMNDDTPDELVQDLMFQAIWGNNPFAYPITGDFESISKMSREQIVGYVKDHYTPDNLIFSLAGNFDPDLVFEKINSYYCNVQSSLKTREVASPVVQSSNIVRIKDIEQAHVCLVTEGVSIVSAERFPLAVLDLALGGGISSRLFQEIREKRGLAYSIHSYKALYRPTGVFGVYAGTSPSNLNEVVKIISDELNNVSINGITEDELTRAKKQLKGSMLLGLESMYYRAYRNAHSLIFFDKIFTVEEICNQIDNITMDDVNVLANRLFTSDKYALSLVGPKDMPVDFDFTLI